MEIPADLLEAKQTLATRLLRTGLQGLTRGMGVGLGVAEAMVSASQQVHGVGVGYKIVNDETTDQLCVHIYVVRKLPLTLLPPRDLLPIELDGIPTDIIEAPLPYISAQRTTKKKRAPRKGTSGPRLSRTIASSAAAAAAPALAPEALACSNNRRLPQRPVVAGISAAHTQVTAGTIACFCRSTLTGEDPSRVFVLSNNHVFAHVNQSQIGDDLLQPGPLHGGTAANHFAELARFVPLQLGGTQPNFVDAAIGELLPGIAFLPHICGVGRIQGVAQGAVGMQVIKHGSNTGTTEGKIDATSVSQLVGMDSFNPPRIVARFENQLRIRRDVRFPAFALSGDSGSLVIDKATNRAVGLFFTSPPSGVFGVANPIEEVLARLRIEIL